MPPRPARTAPNPSTNTENSHGATNDTARPVIVYRPNATPSLPCFAICSSRARADDCDGPMNMHSNSPHTQKATEPDSTIKVSVTTTIATSDATMTGFDPVRWSTNPPSTAPTAATTLATTPNISTLACEMPYTLTPSTAPNAKIAASPSRKSALANRK